MAPWRASTTKSEWLPDDPTAFVPTKQWKSPCITTWDDSRNQNHPTDSAKEAFNQSQFFRSKRYIMALYQGLCDEILQSILESPVIHIDETTVRFRKQKGYVWVLTTMDKVYYFYKPSREATFLQQMLATFSGVLISEFYTAYDSLK